MRTFIAAANWKMNCTKEQARNLIQDLLDITHTLDKRHRVIVAVPNIYLMMAEEMISNREYFYVAAQNVHHEDHGAYTGEVSAPMLKSIGIRYVLVGHSERREIFGDTDEIVKIKLDKVLENDMKVIFCCGEPLEVREAGEERAYVKKQLENSLFHLNPHQFKKVVIAYEPVWAIGTGKTATRDQAQEMHFYLRNLINEKYGEIVANTTSILYGGSVKADNAAELFNSPSVDGGLVGGASLIAADFEKIIESLKR